MDKFEKEKQIKKNKTFGTIVGALLGLIFCGLAGYGLGGSIEVYTDEEWKEVIQQRKIAELKYEEQRKLDEKNRSEKEKQLRELEVKKLELEKEMLELSGKTITGFVYGD